MLNLVIDGNILENEFNRESSNRTGVFFVVHNVFLLLVKSGKYNLFLYADNVRYNGVVEYLRKYSVNNVAVLGRDDIIGNIKAINIFLSMCPVFPVPDFVASNKQIACFSILYDVTPLLFDFEKPNIGWFNKLIESFDREHYYFAISQSAKNDFLVRYSAIDPDKVTVALLAASKDFYECNDKPRIEKIKEKYGIPENKRYALSLCTLQPRKNLEQAVKSFLAFLDKNNINDLVFALGGAYWDEFYIKIKNLINNEKTNSRVVALGYIEDSDLAALYSGAEFFVYTSLYEGFGLPVLEAMQCGCPVITSNNSSIPEVIGDAGIMIDPCSKEEHIAAMEKLYFNHDLRKRNSEDGLLRSKQFSWENTVDIMMGEFDKTAGTGKKIRKKAAGSGIKSKIKKALKNLPVIKQINSRYWKIMGLAYEQNQMLKSISGELNKRNVMNIEVQLERLQSWDLVKGKKTIPSLEEEIRGVDRK